MQSSKRNLSEESRTKWLSVKNRAEEQPGSRVKKQSANDGKAHVVGNGTFSVLEIAPSPESQEAKRSRGKKSVHSHSSGKQIVKQDT